MTMESLRRNTVFRGALADVAVGRERSRQRRLWRLGAIGVLLCVWLWVRLLRDQSIVPVPHFSGTLGQSAPMLLLVLILGSALFIPLLAAGRSPHVLFRSSEITTSLDDVKGMPVVVDEVVKTLNLFLAYKTFENRMGGTPRRAILFEGP